LQAAISELPHKLKTALILFSLENRSQAECAELLGVSAKTVETRVYRARKLLEKRLADVL
jgi:RNA polymerase sigma factor CnrH